MRAIMNLGGGEAPLPDSPLLIVDHSLCTLNPLPHIIAAGSRKHKITVRRKGKGPVLWI